jgi:hypothetical protein
VLGANLLWALPLGGLIWGLDAILNPTPAGPVNECANGGCYPSSVGTGTIDPWNSAWMFGGGPGGGGGPPSGGGGPAGGIQLFNGQPSYWRSYYRTRQAPRRLYMPPPINFNPTSLFPNFHLSPVHVPVSGPLPIGNPNNPDKANTVSNLPTEATLSNAPTQPGPSAAPSPGASSAALLTGGPAMGGSVVSDPTGNAMPPQARTLPPLGVN